MGTVVDRRRAQQLESLGAIEGPHNEKMREPFDISKPQFKFRQNFENALRVVLGPRTLRDLLCVGVGRCRVSDCLRREHSRCFILQRRAGSCSRYSRLITKIRYTIPPNLYASLTKF